MIHECEFCKRKYKNSVCLTAHKYSAHNNEMTGKFKCKSCSKKFKSEKRYQQHMKSHTEKVSLKCNECGAEFKAQKYLRKHCHQFNHDIKFQCSCGRKFITERAIKHHQTSLSVQCTIYPFESTENNKEEDETKSKRVTRLSVLEISRTKVKVKKYRQTKLKFSTNNRVKKSKCKVNKKIQCKICHKMCGGARYLTYHMWKTHNIEREFKCTKCDYTANREDQMRMHENRHKTVSIPCPQCDMLFVSLQLINVHKNHAHNVQNNQNEMQSNVSLSQPSLNLAENNGTTNADKNQILIKNSQDENQNDSKIQKSSELIEKSSKSPVINESLSKIPVTCNIVKKRWQDYQYGCGHCQIGFDDNTSLWEHLLTKHEF